MKFNFGEKMKNLRKKRDLTQEQLAEYLGVSFQAVSKWETNAAYPDISLFPVIANFYGVTTDELLGVDITQAKEKQEEYFKNTYDLYRQWKLVEMVELARKGCLEFPGNHEMLNNLAWCLYESYGMMSTANLDEAIEISKKILEESTDTSLRNNAASRIVYCYNANGDKEKALEYTGQLPNHAHTRQLISGRLGLHQGQKQIEFSQACISMYYEALAEVMMQYANINYDNAENKLTHEEKIEVLENMLKIQQAIYGDNLCDQHFDAYEYNRIIACIYLLMGKKDKALDYLETAFSHAERFMQYKDGDKYQSVTLKNVESRPHSRWSRSPFEDMLDKFTNQDRYDVIRDDPRFIAMLDKIK